jgi:hypothetical protein
MLLRFNLLSVHNLYEVLLIFSTIILQFLIYTAAEAVYDQKLCESPESKIKTLIITSKI